MNSGIRGCIQTARLFLRLGNEVLARLIRAFRGGDVVCYEVGRSQSAQVTARGVARDDRGPDQSTD